MTVEDIAKYCLKNNYFPSDISREFSYSQDKKDKEVLAIYRTLSDEEKKDIDKLYWAISKEQSDKRRAAKDKREAKLKAEGTAIVNTLNPGDVAMVTFGRSIWTTRGMKVLEIEDGFIAGFYLDRKDRLVPADMEEKEGYFYTKPNSWTTVLVNEDRMAAKYEWDGKTFKKTRTYETKMIKFVKSKVENPVINK